MRHLRTFSAIAAILVAIAARNPFIGILWLAVAVLIQSIHSDAHHPLDTFSGLYWKIIACGVAALAVVYIHNLLLIPMIFGLVVYELSIHERQHDKYAKLAHTGWTWGGLASALTVAYVMHG